MAVIQTVVRFMLRSLADLICLGLESALRGLIEGLAKRTARHDLNLIMLKKVQEL